MLNVYNRVRYPTAANTDTLPTSLGAAAQLRGRGFVPFAGARVLEIGCGTGDNLMSLAAMAPGASFIGFDLAAGPIAEGNAVAAEAGLGNVTLMAGDILDPAVVDGAFDYVIAHGVYAWVPEAVREGLMALIGRVLSPDGVAFVSYNTLPGCNIRLSVRSALLGAVQGITDPDERIAAAQAALSFYEAAWSDGSPIAAALQAEVKRTRERPTAVLFHDELGDTYAPQMVSDVVAHVRRQGLDYLGDTQPLYSARYLHGAEANALRQAAGGDAVAFDQLQDHASQRMFRETLLVRAGAPVAAAGSDPARLAALWGRARFTPVASKAGGGHAFRTAKGAVFESDGAELGEVLNRMTGAMPVPLADIDDPRIVASIVDLYLLGQVQLLTAPPPVIAVPGVKPMASPLARVQAQRGSLRVASLRHETVELDEPAAFLLSVLDGRTDRATLVGAMAAATGASAAEVAVRLPQALQGLCRLGLIVA